MRRRFWSKARKIWRNHVRPVLIIVAVLTSFRSAIADWNDVPTGSMKPSILEGDRIVVNKLAYGLKVPFTTWHLMHWGSPQRGEIVVFNSPADGLRLVKRVVGLPGDTVQLIDNRLYINGSPMSYEPLDNATIARLSAAEQPVHGYAREMIGQSTHPVMSTPSNVAAPRWYGPVTIPEGHYFVMGDNRDNSNDSRFIGAIPRDQIVGRSSYVALSLNYDNHFIPRWDRFFQALP